MSRLEFTVNLGVAAAFGRRFISTANDNSTREQELFELTLSRELVDDTDGEI